MPFPRTKYRVVEDIGEIWLADDGTYSFRCFEYGFTEGGFKSVYHAEIKLETHWAAESKRHAGLMEGFESKNKVAETKYQAEAFELLRKKW